MWQRLLHESSLHYVSLFQVNAVTLISQQVLALHSYLIITLAPSQIATNIYSYI